jgi:hypothetical protein
MTPALQGVTGSETLTADDIFVVVIKPVPVISDNDRRDIETIQVIITIDFLIN